MVREWHFPMIWYWLGIVGGFALLLPVLFWKKRRLSYTSFLSIGILLILVYIWWARLDWEYNVYISASSSTSQSWHSLQLTTGRKGIEMQLMVSQDNTPRAKGDMRSHSDESVAVQWRCDPVSKAQRPFPDPARGFAGFDAESRGAFGKPFLEGGKFMRVAFPYWAGIIGFGCVPVMWLVRQPGRRRRYAGKQGLCEVCLFDLRGTPVNQDGSFKCGECGHVNESIESGKSGEVVVAATPAPPAPPQA